MCGISGLVNCGDRETLAHMTHVQAHRGPDDAGLWEQRFPDGSYVGLGSRRLSIIIPPAGTCPCATKTERSGLPTTVRFTILPNYAAIWRGRAMDSHQETDTEVIIHLYEQEGPDCVKRLNGMFAFGICDLRSGKPTLFLARDHFGIKPFYYVQQGRRFALRPKSRHCCRFLGSKWRSTKSTPPVLDLPGFPIPRRCSATFSDFRPGITRYYYDQLGIAQYWDLSFPSRGFQFSRSEAELKAEIRERFRRSVEAQISSDVPIGAFLSAGLDSSSIVAMMSRS